MILDELLEGMLGLVGLIASLLIVFGHFVLQFPEVLPDRIAGRVAHFLNPLRHFASLLAKAVRCGLVCRRASGRGAMICSFGSLDCRHKSSFRLFENFARALEARGDSGALAHSWSFGVFTVWTV